MVTEWINGHMPNEREFSSIGFIADLTTKLKTLHSLKCCKHFNPFNEIKESLVLLRDLSSHLNHHMFQSEFQAFHRT